MHNIGSRGHRAEPNFLTIKAIIIILPGIQKTLLSPFSLFQKSVPQRILPSPLHPSTISLPNSQGTSQSTKDLVCVPICQYQTDSAMSDPNGEEFWLFGYGYVGCFPLFQMATKNLHEAQPFFSLLPLSPPLLQKPQRDPAKSESNLPHSHHPTL